MQPPRFRATLILLPLALGWALACRSGGGTDHPPAAPDGPGAAASQIRLHGWYLTQGTQRLDRSVPLVANRAGVLRVFLVADRARAARPAVRVTLRGPSAAWEQVIPAPAGGVPARFDELDLGASWNLPVPADRLQPGTRICLEVDPGRTVPEVAEAARKVEADLDPKTVPDIRVTLVPVRQRGSGLTGEVTGNGRTLESWGVLFRKLYPVANLVLTEGPVLETSADLDHPDHDHDGDWFTLLGDLEQRRFQDWVAGDRNKYVYGVVRRSHGGGTVGLTPVGSDQGAGYDADGRYQATFAHEMGHALGLGHAPFGLTPAEVRGGVHGWPRDPGYQDANLGAVGMDVASMTLKAPDHFKDIMSYPPSPAQYWVSDHHYRMVLQRLLDNPHQAAPIPQMSGFHPANGPAGTVLTVTGHYLIDIEQVLFLPDHGQPVPAAWASVDPGALQVTVPDPAPTGQLRIRTAGGWCSRQPPGGTFTGTP